MRIPERTIDSMVAIEVSRLEPATIISSPANTLGAVDHLVRNRFAVTVLECKGVDTSDRIPVDHHQLAEYVFGRGPVETIYLLPSRPAGVRSWQRRCALSCCDGVGCRYCPRDARSWTGLEKWVRRLASDDQLQPWFAHWSWCVPAVALARSVGVKGLSSSGTTKLSWDDDALGALPDATRLCHFFGRPAGGFAVSRAVAEAAQGDLTAQELGGLADVDDTAGGTPPLVVLQPTLGQ